MTTADFPIGEPWRIAALWALNIVCLAVADRVAVGSRLSPEGSRKLIHVIAGCLAAAGLWIVSGFARGIDGAAHGATVAAGGATLAVLGCALDYDYPVAHADLKEALIERGGVVSEHRPGTGQLSRCDVAVRPSSTHL